MPHALIVQEDVTHASRVAALARYQGYSTAIAATIEEARQQLVFRRPDVVFVDQGLCEGDVLDALLDDDDECVGGDNDIPEVILMNARVPMPVDGDTEACSAYSAVTSIIEPVDEETIRRALSRVGRTPVARLVPYDRSIALKGVVPDRHRFGRLWGRSAAMSRVFEQIRRVSPTSATVLIVGESGTGKELVAQTIHDMSRRATQPFLAVNCGAISSQLIESEMFGHEKGSFTGATRQHKGYFERAHGGTLFLDEITEMPAELQVKLLRVLETGVFMRVGSDEPIAADVRIVAATNRVPREAVTAGRLREDLYYRLNVFPLTTPTLRERPDDIEPLVDHFLMQFNADEGASKSLSASAIARLHSHDWPGNVRELRNVIQRAHIMAEGDRIEVEHLPLDLAPAAAGAAGVSAFPGPMTVEVGMSIAEVERSLILATLEQVAGDKRQAADMLGISLKTLYNRLREYGAARLEEFRGEPLRASGAA